MISMMWILPLTHPRATSLLDCTTGQSTFYNSQFSLRQSLIVNICSYTGSLQSKLLQPRTQISSSVRPVEMPVDDAFCGRHPTSTKRPTSGLWTDMYLSRYLSARLGLSLYYYLVTFFWIYHDHSGKLFYLFPVLPECCTDGHSVSQGATGSK